MKEVRNLSVGLIEKDELISVELDSDFCSTKFGSVALLPPYALVIDCKYFQFLFGCHEFVL